MVKKLTNPKNAPSLWVINSSLTCSFSGTLNSKAKWINPFTNDLSQVIQIFPTNKKSKPFTVNMDEYLFPILEENLQEHLPTVMPDGILSHVCRVIIVYKSSVRIPVINSLNFSMFNSPGVIFDVLYIHDIPSDENKVELIFQNLNGLNTSGNSYLLEVLNNQIIAIYNTMSILLAHPLQRAPQKYFNTDLRYILSEKQEDENPIHEEPQWQWRVWVDLKLDLDDASQTCFLQTVQKLIFFPISGIDKHDWHSIGWGDYSGRLWSYLLKSLT